MNKYLAAVLTFITSAVLWFSLLSFPAAAATTYSYNSSYLISDQYFTDSNSMTASQIQSFLNGKNSGIRNLTDTENCSTIQTPYSFTYYPNCGKKVSAATIIYDAGRAYGISQKAILATLQKEQSLVTDPSPTSAAINCAMGYNSCSGFSGFFSQVDNGTWQFRTYIELMNGRSWWGYAPSTYPCRNGRDVDPSNDLYSTGLYPGRTVTFYNSGGTAKTVRLDNSATAALYCYTPYVGPKYTTYGYAGTGYSGSFNFVISYEQWWGSTIFPWAADLSASTDQQFYGTLSDCQAGTNPISLSGATFKTGDKYWVKITATNTGSNTWSSSFVHIATASPNNHTGIFDDGSWLSSNRPAGLSTSSVAPNGVGVFNCFSITANSKVDGHYTEQYQLVADGQDQGWMQDNAAFTLGMQVSNPFNGTITQLNEYRDSNYTKPVDPSVMTYSQKIYVSLKVKNIGSSTWSNSFTKLAYIGSDSPQSYLYDSSWPESNRPAHLQESSVSPGATGDFKFVITAPSTSGTYTEPFQLVADGQDNGWMPDTNFNFTVKVVPSPLDSLYNGYRLYPDQSVTSKNGNYSLVFQGDGNLVLYTSGHPLWASNTNGKSAGSLVMQGDGNLVIYNTDGRPIWASNTGRNGASTAVLQNDGNFVIYDNGRPTWASGTEHNISNTPSILPAYGKLSAGEWLMSSDGSYTLNLTGNGDLVIAYRGDQIWHSGTSGGSASLVMQGDGNLVLYSSGRPIWASNTNGKGISSLEMQTDGNLVIYDGNGRPTWASGTNSQT